MLLLLLSGMLVCTACSVPSCPVGQFLHGCGGALEGNCVANPDDDNSITRLVVIPTVTSIAGAFVIFLAGLVYKFYMPTCPCSGSSESGSAGSSEVEVSDENSQTHSVALCWKQNTSA
jgi:hypothetical protein